jgi:hypothetical protein
MNAPLKSAGDAAASYVPPRVTTAELASAPGLSDGAAPGVWKAVYTIVERAKGRRIWLRIGTAFVNRDQSLNVRLDALPISGQLHIRETMHNAERDSSSTAATSELPAERSGRQVSFASS